MMIPKLGSYWNRIQNSLFPKLESAFDQRLTEEHKKVAQTLDIYSGWGNLDKKTGGF